RAARRCPQVLAVMAEGRVHLTGVVRLRPYLTSENATDLLKAATHKSKAEIVKLLVERFPSPDLPSRVVALAPAPAAAELVPEPVPAAPTTGPGAGPAPVPQHVLPPGVDHARLAPLAPERYGVQFTFDQAGHD